MPILSAVIIGSIVALSVYVGYKLNPSKYF